MQDNFHSDDPIGQKFRELGNRAEGVIVAYLMGHDPDPKAFMTNAVSLIEGGADILEIGIPFSDPVAALTLSVAALLVAVPAELLTTTR